MKTKKRQKRRIANPTITPTINVFRHSELDTVAILAKRVFLRKAIVLGWSKTQNKTKGSLASLTHLGRMNMLAYISTVYADFKILWPKLFIGIRSAFTSEP